MRILVAVVLAVVGTSTFAQGHCGLDIELYNGLILATYVGGDLVVYRDCRVAVREDFGGVYLDNVLIVANRENDVSEAALRAYGGLSAVASRVGEGVSLPDAVRWYREEERKCIDEMISVVHTSAGRFTAEETVERLAAVNCAQRLTREIVRGREPDSYIVYLLSSTRGLTINLESTSREPGIIRSILDCPRIESWIELSRSDTADGAEYCILLDVHGVHTVKVAAGESIADYILQSTGGLK